MRVVIALAKDRDVELVTLILDVHAGIESILTRRRIVSDQPFDRDVVLILVVAFHAEIVRMVGPQIERIADFGGGVARPVLVVGGVIAVELDRSGVVVGQIGVCNAVSGRVRCCRDRAPCAGLASEGSVHCSPSSTTHSAFLHVFIHVECEGDLPLLVVDRALVGAW